MTASKRMKSWSVSLAVNESLARRIEETARTGELGPGARTTSEVVRLLLSDGMALLHRGVPLVDAQYPEEPTSHRDVVAARLEVSWKEQLNELWRTNPVGQQSRSRSVFMADLIGRVLAMKTAPALGSAAPPAGAEIREVPSGRPEASEGQTVSPSGARPSVTRTANQVLQEEGKKFVAAVRARRYAWAVEHTSPPVPTPGLPSPAGMAPERVLVNYARAAARMIAAVDGQAVPDSAADLDEPFRSLVEVAEAGVKSINSNGRPIEPRPPRRKR